MELLKTETIVWSNIYLVNLSSGLLHRKIKFTTLYKNCPVNTCSIQRVSLFI